MFRKFCFLLILTLSVSACKKEEQLGVGRYGMLDDGTPQYTAVRFMQSLYHDENIDNVLALSSERMKRVLKRYHTNRNVQRHVMNLMYDTVEVSPEGSDGVGRSEFSKEATVILFFSGHYNEDKIDDIRTIEMVKVDGDWKVDRIQPDRFL
ncbi:hypothetical protein DRW07_08180 [Alteromonas sediminis]|uniref:Lipoprotein n=1 Tax=Alteromonas sediminis TaxID=2259342 RepID=A0A3N5YD96_9ALTE|nr:hypothetical protein [Alteromonas sediminis]RPJ67485.1 hypothetical protein DRW07_08180 [Alteromonas sediminis]